MARSSAKAAGSERLKGFDLSFETLLVWLVDAIDSRLPTQGKGGGSCQCRAEDQYQGRA